LICGSVLGHADCASADFVCLEVQDVTSNGLGLREYALFARFDHPLDEVLGIQSNISVTSGFFHNTIAGSGESIFPFTTEVRAQSDYPDADSFVTVGLDTGDGNETVVDQNFDVNGFLFGNSLGTDAGWYNSNPFNDAGLAGVDGLVLLAVFTPLNESKGAMGVVSGVLTLSFQPAGAGLAFANATFITPAPGALGLLALAGVMGRRRGRAGDSSGVVHARAVRHCSGWCFGWFYRRTRPHLHAQPHELGPMRIRSRVLSAV
jgi:hypothetical protein